MANLKFPLLVLSGSPQHRAATYKQAATRFYQPLRDKLRSLSDFRNSQLQARRLTCSQVTTSKLGVEQDAHIVRPRFSSSDARSGLGSVTFLSGFPHVAIQPLSAVSGTT
ncbi:hypothetical protein HBI46_096170 [Parastagonospora nodorum]|nr:hypothetical protein HBH51_208370 [Parastagonospora nodorum]KAH4001473.1 hypothetical protein HBI10_091440 [Parastagonospora nodorum]KAH4930316.1 hypothetical protein HBH74_101330 [Parastagonospora nodorum]KAH4974417.1 hypothetical protein HBH73_052730 [Parastagonospora nodorum]KAH5419146.1 hypothetical protein HBI46_096170 [Parastagonospora nodorum]